MKKSPDNRPADIFDPESQSSVGEQLRAARESRGWAVEYLAKLTRLRPEQVRDLEADEYRRFGGWLYVRGSVRLCAQQLGLEEGELLAELEAHRGNAPGIGAGSAPFEEEYEEVPVIGYRPERARLAAGMIAHRWGLSVVIGLGAILALLLVVQLVRIGRSGALSRPEQRAVKAQPVEGKSEKASAKAAPAQPVAVARAVSPEEAAKAAEADAAAEEKAKAAAAPPASQSHALVLEARDQSFVRVVDTESDELLFEGTLVKGDRREFKGRGFQLQLQRPAAVQVQLDDSRIASPAEDERPIELTLP